MSGLRRSVRLGTATAAAALTLLAGLAGPVDALADAPGPATTTCASTAAIDTDGSPLLSHVGENAVGAAPCAASMNAAAARVEAGAAGAGLIGFSVCALLFRRRRQHPRPSPA